MNIRIANPPPRGNAGNIVLVPNTNGTLDEVNINEENKKPFPYFPIHTAVRFELYTPDNPKQPQLLSHSNETTLHSSNFDPNRPTRILIHGWMSMGLLTPRFSEAYFILRNYNVNYIAVNWRDGADTINYSGARRRVNVVGPYVAQFINFLVERGNMNLKDVTVIGHSLGAHVAGIGNNNKKIIVIFLFDIILNKKTKQNVYF